jgi:U3 small nucleolar RNA-associated protein 6
VAKKEDFFEYAEYEIGLEKLRRLRWKRLSGSIVLFGYTCALTLSRTHGADMDKNAPKRTISCYSIPRRVVYILRRATQKFSYDIAAWLAYVDYARSEKMSKVVQSGLTR